MSEAATAKIRKPKDVKQKSNRRNNSHYKEQQSQLDQSQYEWSNDTYQTGKKSTSLNRSIENIFLEKSFDSSMFSVRPPSKASLSQQQQFQQTKPTPLEKTTSNSIYDIYSTITNSCVTLNNMSGNDESRGDASVLVMKDIFGMENRSVDLEMYSDLIRWKDISVCEYKNFMRFNRLLIT